MSDKLNQDAETYYIQQYGISDKDHKEDVIEDFKAGHASRDHEVTKLQSDLKKAVESLESICGSQCAYQNPCEARSILRELRGEL